MRPIVPVAALILLLSYPSAVAAQLIPLITKLTGLAGVWTRDTTRGAGGICGVPVPVRVEIAVTPTEIEIRTNVAEGTVKLDGSETTLSDGRTARASLDAGWLKITMRRQRNGGSVNVMQEVYIVTGNDLTIWRALNVVLPDGGDGKIDCDNRHAIVFTRK
jgi:hypothetical protein